MQLARLIASKPYTSDLLDSYVNSRLISLTSAQGIGIRENFRRKVGKCFSWELKTAIQIAAGPLQVCTGQKSGSEAAVQFTREQSEALSAEAVILIDASNTFNSVNRQALLHNVRVLFPELSMIAINMYRKSCGLFVGGSDRKEKLGDNMAMLLFVIGSVHIWRQQDFGKFYPPPPLSALSDPPWWRQHLPDPPISKWHKFFQRTPYTVH